MATSCNTLYRSENGGITWTTQLLPGFGGPLAYSPDFAADRTAFLGGSALWRTTDGGLAWRPVLSEGVRSLAVSPAFAIDGTVFAGGLDGWLAVSDNGGTTWITRTLATTAATVNALIVSPSYVTDTTVFAGCHGGLFRSTDGGVTWAPVPLDAGIPVNALAISPDWPTDPVMLAGTPAGVYRTDDGGTTWTRHGFTLLDVTRLTGAPNSTGLLAGTDRQGLFQQTGPDRPWEPSGLYGHSFIDVAAAPAYPVDSTLFASVAAGAGMNLTRSDDAGGTWTLLGSEDVVGGYWALSPEYAQDGTVYVTGEHGRVLRSPDRGATWHEVGTWPTPSGPARFVLHSPDDPADATLWAAGNGIWHLDPGETVWVSATLPIPNAQITDIAQSPGFAQDHTLLATGYGRETGATLHHYTILRSMNAGATWSTATLGISDTTPLVALAFSPQFAFDRTAFAVSRDALLRSTDGGERWVTVGAPSGAGELHDVVAHGYGRASVATDEGVWQYATDWEEVIVNGGFEDDGGWLFANTPLPAAVTREVTHTGSRAARIGVGPGSGIPTAVAYSSVRQTVTIPSDTLTATLHVYYLPKTEETVAATPPMAAGTAAAVDGDLQYAMILETGEFLFYGLIDADDWLSRTVDLSSYAGASLTLHFGVLNDGENGHTGMILDDVSLLNRRLRPADLMELIYLPLITRAG
jgi:photosystem II stability/assembly factor-like uncharacterized protein